MRRRETEPQKAAAALERLRERHARDEADAKKLRAENARRTREVLALLLGAESGSKGEPIL